MREVLKHKSVEKVVMVDIDKVSTHHSIVVWQYTCYQLAGKAAAFQHVCKSLKQAVAEYLGL